MDYQIRNMKKEEYPLLKDFLYKAIFILEGEEPPPSFILELPELQEYIAGFGRAEHDRALAAEIGGKAAGAVWGRIMKDYGRIDERTPSLAISVLEEYRGLGIGTALLREMLCQLREGGYEKASLSVQKRNRAVRLYRRAGFSVWRETEEEYIMEARLRERCEKKEAERQAVLMDIEVVEEIMTEREKMLAGQLYDCGDAELLSRWHKAKDLVRDYNQTDSANTEEKERILNELLGGKGKNLWITPPFYVDYGNNIYFGDNCEVNMNCIFLDDNRIVIGRNALIAPNVQIYTAFHPANARDRFGSPKKDGTFEFCKTQTAPVIIGDDVWIGGGAIIMPGVTIGNNVVIGAGSVVTKDIPDNVVAFGNPCRVMRENK